MKLKFGHYALHKMYFCMAFAVVKIFSFWPKSMAYIIIVRGFDVCEGGGECECVCVCVCVCPCSTFVLQYYSQLHYDIAHFFPRWRYTVQARQVPL